MNDNIIKIQVNELLESLKIGYKEYRDCLKNNHDEEELAHIKGFYVAIEQILLAYGEVTKEEILDIKRPIIGEVSFGKKSVKVDYDIPTFMRKQQD